MSIKVTALDEQTGDTDTCYLSDNPQPGNYVLTCGPGTALVRRTVFGNGTEVITLKAADDDAEVKP